MCGALLYDYYIQCPKCKIISSLMLHVSRRETDAVFPKLLRHYCCVDIDYKNLINNKWTYNYSWTMCDSENEELFKNATPYDFLINFQKTHKKDYTEIINYAKKYCWFGINKIYECEYK